MKYFKDNNGEVFAYDEETQSQLITKAIENNLEDVTNIWPPVESESTTILNKAKTLLNQADKVVIRTISQGRDFPQEWVNYMEALREVIRGNTNTIPEIPNYP